MTYNIIDVIKDEIKGTTDILEQPEIQKRKNICHSCPDFKPLTRSCGHCGCFIDMKTRYRQSMCPIDKW